MITRRPRRAGNQMEASDIKSGAASAAAPLVRPPKKKTKKEKAQRAYGAVKAVATKKVKVRGSA
jgi:hypothetical protein